MRYSSLELQWWHRITSAPDSDLTAGLDFNQVCAQRCGHCPAEYCSELLGLARVCTVQLLLQAALAIGACASGLLTCTPLLLPHPQASELLLDAIELIACGHALSQGYCQTAAEQHVVAAHMDSTQGSLLSRLHTCLLQAPQPPTAGITATASAAAGRAMSRATPQLGTVPVGTRVPGPGNTTRVAIPTADGQGVQLVYEKQAARILKRREQAALRAAAAPAAAPTAAAAGSGRKRTRAASPVRYRVARQSMAAAAAAAAAAAGPSLDAPVNVPPVVPTTSPPASSTGMPTTMPMPQVNTLPADENSLSQFWEKFG